jgi:hypothetical protein
MVTSLGGLASKAKVTAPKNFIYLLFWFTISTFSILFGFTKFFSIMQTLFFAFNILIVFFVFNFVHERNFDIIIKYYVWSFVFVAMFGIIQWLLGFLGISLLVTEWWKFHEIARVNGFSYEPSYFSTYLSAGFVSTGYLKDRKFRKIKHIKLFHYAMLTAILISTSRMVILLVAIWYSQYLYRSIRGLLRKKLIKSTNIAIVAIIIVILTFGFVVVAVGPEKFIFLFNGVGLFGRSDSSVIQRSDQFYDTLKIFLQHPIFGVGTGGGNYFMAADHYGSYTTNIDLLRKNPGMNVSAEALADSGIIGFVFYCLYFYGFFKKLRNLKSQNDVVAALLLGLLSEMFLLQFNQDILRVYLWIQIALLSVSIKLLPRKINLGN